MRHCLTLLEPEVRARAADVHVGVLPEVNGEEPMIGAVFMNLLVNALKYGPRQARRSGWVAARARGVAAFVRERGRPDRARGPGADLRALPAGRGERRIPGSGLGLTICRQIVERHGGVMSVEPGPEGTGNCFSFTLPA